MWDCNGVEQIHDISSFEEESEAKVFAILAGIVPPPDTFPNLQTMKLRALYNTPRHYRIYGIKLTQEFTDDIIADALKPRSKSRLKNLIISKGIDLG